MDVSTRKIPVEYAKSARSTCKGCGGGINNGALRIGKETPSPHHDGFDCSWFHYKCSNKGWGSPVFKQFSQLKDPELLRWEDQVKIRKDIGEAAGDEAENKLREKYITALWKQADELDEEVKNPIIKSLCEANNVRTEKISPAILQLVVADGLIKGAPGPCPTCKNVGCLRFNGVEYFCKGYVSAYTRCEYKGKDDIKRYKFKMPADVKKTPYFKNWTAPAGYPTEEMPASVASGGASSTTTTSTEGGKTEETKMTEASEPQVLIEKEDKTLETEEPPKGMEMWGMVCCVAGTQRELGTTQAALKEMIEDHGGEVYDDIVDETTVMICGESELNKKKRTKKVEAAYSANIPFFKSDFVTHLCDRTEEGIKLRGFEVAKKYLIEGSPNPENRIARHYSKAKVEAEKAAAEKAAAAGARGETNYVRKKRPQPVKGSDILKVEPNSGHSDCEIFVDYDDTYGYTPYNVMFNQSDVAKGTNKFYQIQLVKNKTKEVYYLYKRWGRVGVDDVGSAKDERMGLKAAKEEFAVKFLDCSGVLWENRDQFVKQPGRYSMVDLDDGNEELGSEPLPKRQKVETTTTTTTTSSADALPARVKDLISLIFDKNMMAKALETMKIDVKKMPLGKIKKSQIKDAYKALTDIQDVLQKPPVNDSLLRDASNRFYTLIPHDFGRSAPPLIDNLEKVKAKLDMLDTLDDLEVATTLMNQQTTSEEDPAVKNYKSLKCKLTPLDKDSERYKLAESYAYTTHDKNYFSQFDFEVLDIFEVDREGETDRFQAWSKNDNRRLLWHGSRLTNWVGILSQGLRIAPPEAPKSGYRLGKGIYLADIISKSGSYCATSKDAPYAVMMLCEAALGNEFQTKNDFYMEKPQPGTNSTHALGQFIPHESSYVKIEDSLTVPVGKPSSSGVKSAFSHNEYVIYDVNQAKIRYVFKMKFKHKNSW